MAKEKKTIIKSTNLNDLLQSIEKDFGSGSIAQGNGSIVNVQVFSTQVASIDYALGCGGLPLGRIIEIYGPESGGKTTTCLQIAKACQNHYFKDKKRNGVVAFIDAEHALDIQWAKKIGVNTDNLIISQPDSGEEGFQIIERIVDSGLVDLVVVDSVAALVPRSILEGDISDANMGALAQLMGKGLGKIRGKCNNTKTTIIFINQLREKVGQMFGNPEHTPGGRALKFYASIRMEIKKVAPIKEKDDIIAFRTRSKVVKNKVAAPFLEAEYDICVGKDVRPIFGIDEVASLIEISDKIAKVFTKRGSNYYFGETHVGNGINNTIQNVRSNETIMNEIKDRTYKAMFGDIQKRQNFAINIEETLDTDGLDDGILDGGSE